MNPLLLLGLGGAGIMAAKALWDRSTFNERLEYARMIGVQHPEQYTDLEALKKAIEAREAINRRFRKLTKRAKRLNLIIDIDESNLSLTQCRKISELLKDFETAFKRLSEAHYSVELEAMLLSKENRDRFTEWVDFHLAWSQQFYLINKELPKDWRIALPSHQYDARELQVVLERLKAQHAHWAIFKKRIFAALGFAWMLPMVYFLF